MNFSCCLSIKPLELLAATSPKASRHVLQHIFVTSLFSTSFNTEDAEPPTCCSQKQPPEVFYKKRYS